MTISASDDGRGFETFRGFWVQARASENGEAIGSFIAIADNKTKTFGCPSEATDVSTKKDLCTYWNLFHSILLD